MGNEINFYRRKTDQELAIERARFRENNRPYAKGDPTIEAAMLARDVANQDLWEELEYETSGHSSNKHILETILPPDYQAFRDHILTEKDIDLVLAGLVRKRAEEHDYIVQILAGVLYYLTQGVEIKVWEN